MPDAAEPQAPSAASLAKAICISLGIAFVLLVFVVLPAEVNVDPTGFGHAIGVTVLSAPPPDPAPAPAGPATAPPSTAARTDQALIDVPPGKGLEYKFHVRAGEKFKYSWSCGPGDLLYDFHGEPKGAAKNVFESYAEGVASGAKGTLTTPFEGAHGWYWKNMGRLPVRVTLDTTGNYEVLGLR